MATSTTNFLNMIKASIRRHIRYPITDVGFKLVATDSDGTNSSAPFPSSGYIIGANPVPTQNQAKIGFQYTWTSGNYKYYLPAINADNVREKITDIEVWCKFNIISSTGVTITGNDTAGNSGLSSNEWTHIHTASNTSGVTFDRNDYIESISVDLQLETSASALPAHRLVGRFFAQGTGNITDYDNRPYYFKFTGESNNGEPPYLIDTDNNSNFYTGEPTYDSNAQLVSGRSVMDQFNDINIITDGFPSSDGVRCNVFLPPQITAGGYVDQKPISYELYTSDNTKIDEGELNEDSDSTGHDIPWQPGDSVSFTYTNNVLNKG